MSSRRKGIAATSSATLVRKDHCVSLWCGIFPSESALEEFIDSGAFEREQGFTIEGPLFPFHAFDDESSPETLIQSLVQDTNIVALALGALGKKGMNSFVLHEHFEYRPEAASSGRKRMMFLGSHCKTSARGPRKES